MTHSALFLYPFQKQLIPQEFLAGSRLIVNAGFDAVFDTGGTDVAQLTVAQYNQTKFEAWKNKQAAVVYDVSQIKERWPFKTVFCHIPQSKEQALYFMAQILNCLEEGGVFVALGGNNENGKSLKKWFKEFGLESQSESKQKHRIVWAFKQYVNQAVVNNYLEKYGYQQVKLNNQDYYTKPGVYGWNKIDQGSKLLVENMPDGLKGFGADFGCGYGFLSKNILNSTNDIKAIDLYDNDYYAIESSKINLKNASCQINYYLKDIEKSKIDKKYNWIVMNPPFHQGKKMDSNIGLNFIQKAAQSLQSGGMLYMVANNFLPYEKIVKHAFKSFDIITEDNGFKVIFAQK